MSTKARVICIVVGILLIISGMVCLSLFDLGGSLNAILVIPMLVGIMFITLPIAEYVDGVLSKSVERQVAYYKKIDELYEMLKSQDEEGGAE